MRPDASAINILSTTRATAKMHEFRVAPEDFIALPRSPAILFALAVGLLGDVAATIANRVAEAIDLIEDLPVPPSWGETGPTPIEGLNFASVYFDAFLNAQLDDTITAEFSLLCASAYYLSGNVGSASVIIRHAAPPDLEIAEGLARLVYAILNNNFVPIEGRAFACGIYLGYPGHLGWLHSLRQRCRRSPPSVRSIALGGLCEGLSPRTPLFRSHIGNLRDETSPCRAHGTAGGVGPRRRRLAAGAD
jgi:hypothetical protein